MARMSCQDGPTAVLREMQSSQEKTLKKKWRLAAIFRLVPRVRYLQVICVRSAARSAFGEKHIITALDATRRAGPL